MNQAVDHGEVGVLEDVLRVCQLDKTPSTYHLRFVDDHIKSLEKSLKFARQQSKNCETDWYIKAAVADLESEISVIISDIHDLQKVVNKFHNFAVSAVDAVHDWKEVMQDRLTEDERLQWIAIQIQNKIIESMKNKE